MKKLFVLGWISLLVTMNVYAESFKTYVNNRFNFMIQYPDFLNLQEELENHEGQMMKGREAELNVWGAYSAIDISESFSNTIEKMKDFKVVSKTRKDNYYIIIAENAAQIAYYKTIYTCGETLCLSFYYPKNNQSLWQPIVTQISDSFKYASSTCRANQD